MLNAKRYDQERKDVEDYRKIRQKLEILLEKFLERCSYSSHLSVLFNIV